MSLAKCNFGLYEPGIPILYQHQMKLIDFLKHRISFVKQNINLIKMYIFRTFVYIVNI
jgi:hypothetical protein